MAFTLTRAHVQKLFDATAQGELGAFLAQVEPDVVWRMGASGEEGKGRSGVYVSAERE